MPFGRNRESRSREAAGRRNWARSSAQEHERQKRLLTALSDSLSCRGLDVWRAIFQDAKLSS